ncbi:MAG: DoxX family membrane protein, partial [Gemmatimonadales bacterium]
MTTTDATHPAGLPDAHLLGRGLAVLRIFFGSIALLNGIAKLIGWRNVHLGPYRANLIDREDARNILDFEVFRNPENGKEGTSLPGIRKVSELMLDHWDLVGWALTALEIGTGLLLVLGLFTRGAALAALSMHAFLTLAYASSNRWLFEQPHEYV